MHFSLDEIGSVGGLWKLLCEEVADSAIGHRYANMASDEHRSEQLYITLTRRMAGMPH
jgi:hypothetical protein